MAIVETLRVDFMEKCHARGGIFQSCAASLVSLRGNETLRVLPGGAVMVLRLAWPGWLTSIGSGLCA